MTKQRKNKPKELLEFGLRMRERREMAGLSQEGLALRADLHRTYIGSVERGERNISLLNIHRLARALNCRISDLTRDLSDKGQ